MSDLPQALRPNFLASNGFLDIENVPAHVWQELAQFCERMLAKRSSSSHVAPQAQIGDVWDSLPSPISPVYDQRTRFSLSRTHFGQHSQDSDLVKSSVAARDNIDESRTHGQLVGTSSSGLEALQLGDGWTMNNVISTRTFLSLSPLNTENILPEHYGQDNELLAQSLPFTLQDTSDYASPPRLALPFNSTTNSIGLIGTSDSAVAADGSIFCQWENCHDKITSASVSAIGNHLKMRHFGGKWDTRELVRCLWNGCSSQTLLQCASLGKHIGSRHVLSTKSYCNDCKKSYSRKDSFYRHFETCSGRRLVEQDKSLVKRTSRSHRRV